MKCGALGYLPAVRLIKPTTANGPFFALYYKERIKVFEGPVVVKDYSGDLALRCSRIRKSPLLKTTIAAAYPSTSTHKL